MYKNMAPKDNLILDRDAPVLRETALEVPVEEINSQKIKAVIGKMKAALKGQDDGVAIAAPQMGERLRIFVVSGSVKALAKGEKKKGDTTDEDQVYINPTILNTSKKKSPMEEGCLSVRWLYGEVERHEKVTISAYNEEGQKKTIGASGLLSQIFQHEIDHLNGILFTDKATNVRDLPPTPSFVFFGSSQFSQFVLEELEARGYHPSLNITSAKEDLPIDKLREIDADLFIVASFGKILPQEIVDMPKHGTLNVHPSLLPELRGPSPIQNLILKDGKPGVTIIKMDEKMDHGPIIAQEEYEIKPWPDHYAGVEEKLARAGGQLLVGIIDEWVNGDLEAVPQNHSQATFIKMIKKEDGEISLEADAETNYRKVLAYSRWPGAYLNFKTKMGKEVRVVVKDAEIREGKFVPTRVIPAGKKEMDWQDFLRGNT